MVCYALLMQYHCSSSGCGMGQEWDQPLANRRNHEEGPDETSLFKKNESIISRLGNKFVNEKIITGFSPRVEVPDCVLVITVGATLHLLSEDVKVLVNRQSVVSIASRNEVGYWTRGNTQSAEH